MKNGPGGPLKPGNTIRVSTSKNWCFTLNNYKEDDINNIIKGGPDYKYIFQEEIGEKGTIHLQGFIKFNKRVRPKNLFNPKIHWEKCKGSEKQNIEYCTKLNTKNGKIYTNMRLPKPLKLLKVEDMKKWQLEIIDIINRKPDDRKIYWYWDKIGNTGKSVLSKLLCAKYDALICSGKASDIKYLIVKYHEKTGIYPELLIFDIPRSMIDYMSWTGIEEVKNGCFCSSKYECNMVIMNCPHIICFANSEPDKDKLSIDRWIIREII